MFKRLKDAFTIGFLVFLFPVFLLIFLIEMIVHPMKDREEWHDYWE